MDAKMGFLVLWDVNIEAYIAVIEFNIILLFKPVLQYIKKMWYG